MIFQFIENLSRMIMEWAIRRQSNEMYIVDEIADKFSHRALKELKVK
jgi:hypothetical protein